MTQQELLRQINLIRIGSKWCIKKKKDASYYVNIGTMTLPPHEHISVEMVSLTVDNLMIHIYHRSGYTGMYNVSRFIDLFEEIVYPDAKLKDFVNMQELFRDIKKDYGINLNSYRDVNSRTLQINPATFEPIINYMEKNNLVEPIISKKEADYIKHGKGAESKSYGLQKNNKIPHGPKGKADCSIG